MLWALLVLAVIGVVAKWANVELPPSFENTDGPIGPDEDQW